MAIAASKRLGWIALGIYIERMNVLAPMALRSRYKTMLDWQQATNKEFKLADSLMEWADDYRMVLFPDEFIERLDAIDESKLQFATKELHKAQILRRATRARLELEGSWNK